MEKKSRIHRVGSITTGLSMIVYGVLFLLHMFFQLVSYGTMFKLWPLILIGLGIEVLLSNFFNHTFVYDKGAVFLLIVITCFIFCMALADMCMQYGGVVLEDEIHKETVENISIGIFAFL